MGEQGRMGRRKEVKGRERTREEAENQNHADYKGDSIWEEGFLLRSPTGSQGVPAVI